MFIHRMIYVPAPGREQELSELLADSLPAGVRASLTSRIWGEAPELRLNSWHASLAALEGSSLLGVSSGLSAKAAALLAAPPASELDQIIVEDPGGPAPRYVMRLLYEPAQGKMVGLRPLLETRMRAFNASQEGRVVLATRFSGGPATLYTATLFDSLAQLEATRAAAGRNPAAQQVVAAMAPLLAGPVPAQDIYRVLARSDG